MPIKTPRKCHHAVGLKSIDAFISRRFTVIAFNSHGEFRPSKTNDTVVRVRGIIRDDRRSTIEEEATRDLWTTVLLFG